MLRIFFTKKVVFYTVVVALLSFSGAIRVNAAEGARRSLEPVPASLCAAPFVLPAVGGGVRALAAESGRPVIVHFFATWCEPCRAEFATLQQFFARRGGEISVLAVNVGEVPGRVRRFLEDNPVSFPVVLDEDRAVTKSWAIEGLPTTLVFDRRLNPRLIASGDLDWTTADVGAEIDRALAHASDPQQTRPKCRSQREDSQ